MCLATTALVNGFAPLLFVTFESYYGITLENLAALIALNFLTQVATALLLSKVIDALGYKISSAIALISVMLGLAGLAILPDILPPFIGLCIAVGFYALGSGILNITVNPVVNQCIREESSRSLLFSSYCWGFVVVILVSTLFFHLFGTENWRVLACFWVIIPLACLILFLLSPIKHPRAIMADMTDNADKPQSKIPLRELLSQRVFLVVALAMLCAGASEHAMSQWASMFAEVGLNVSKTAGDLAGPTMFAALMGVSRLLHPLIFRLTRNKITLERYMLASGLLCVGGYMLAAFAPTPVLAFIGCGLCGFAAGIFWPGTISLASKRFAHGGTAMFAVLSLTGNIGGASGPAIVGMILDRTESSFSAALSIVSVFPLILALCVAYYMRKQKGLQ